MQTQPRRRHTREGAEGVARQGGRHTAIPGISTSGVATTIAGARRKVLRFDVDHGQQTV